MKTTQFEQARETTEKPLLSVKKIQDWLVSYLAKHLEIAEDQVDIKLPFDRYNLDSAVTIGMTGELETLLDSTLDPTLVYDYPTIELLAQYLASGAEVSWQKDLHR